MELVIRKADTRDFDQVFGLLKQLWPTKELDYEAMKKLFDQNLQVAHQFYTVVVYGPQIVGFGSLTIKYSMMGCLGIVDEMVVAESYRGQGIGKKLMDHITKIATGQNCKWIELDSSFHREEAHAFYTSLGFEKRAYWFSKKL